MDYIQFGIATTLIVGGILAFSWLSNAYLRASALKAAWGKRIDSLSPTEWETLRNYTTEAELTYVVRTLSNFRAGRGERHADAPTLRDTLVQFAMRLN